jgi:stringent starvation protein B
MISNKPYLIRAIYDWLSDCSLTTQLLVDAEYPDVVVPSEHVKDGKILLNVSQTAVRGIHLGNEMISFSTRFQGRSREIFIPPEGVLAIFARENPEMGLYFMAEPDRQSEPVGSSVDDDRDLDDGVSEGGGNEKERPKGPPNLTVVK